jgi:hypothetical protein
MVGAHGRESCLSHGSGGRERETDRQREGGRDREGEREWSHTPHDLTSFH